MGAGHSICPSGWDKVPFAPRNKSSNTANKHFKQTVTQTVKSEQDVSVDTFELTPVSSKGTDTESGTETKETDTEGLVYGHDECCQTYEFEALLISTPSQTNLEDSLLSQSLTKCKVPQETQTSADHLIELDTGSKRGTISKRKVARQVQHLSTRSEPHMSFKDVSYVKNKTHQLRVAKVQKTKEEAEAKAAKAKRPLKRVGHRSKEDLSRSKENLKKSSESVKVEEELECTCSVDVVDGSVLPPPVSPIPPSIDEEEGEKETESEEEEEETTFETSFEHKTAELEDCWSTASYVFPTEQTPPPITESNVGQDQKFVISDKIPKKLQYVLQEMLTTEEKYVEDLQHVVENYLEPMQHHPDPNINKLAENIFEHFGQIYRFHLNTFKSSLIAAGTSDSPLKDIATTFIRHDPELEVYLLFMVHERKAHAIVEQNHEGYIAGQEQALQDMLGLSAYLIKPTQRMVKYKQFLDIMLAGAEEFEELEEVTDAQTMVTNILNTSNDLCHLQALQLPAEVSHDTTGELLKQADFHVSINNKQKRVRRVFLFENLIVFSKEVTGAGEEGELKYRSKHVVGLHEIGLTPYVAEEPLKCHIWTPEIALTMFGSSPSQAEAWSKCISNILWGQLKQIKRDRDQSRLRKTRGTTRSRGALTRGRR